MLDFSTGLLYWQWHISLQTSLHISKVGEPCLPLSHAFLTTIHSFTNLVTSQNFYLNNCHFKNYVNKSRGYIKKEVLKFQEVRWSFWEAYIAWKVGSLTRNQTWRNYRSKKRTWIQDTNENGACAGTVQEDRGGRGRRGGRPRAEAPAEPWEVRLSQKPGPTLTLFPIPCQPLTQNCSWTGLNTCHHN